MSALAAAAASERGLARDIVVQVRFLPEYCRPGVGRGFTAWNPNPAQLVRRIAEALQLAPRDLRAGYLTAPVYAADGPTEWTADEPAIGNRRVTETPWVWGPCDLEPDLIVPLAELETGLELDALKAALAAVIDQDRSGRGLSNPDHPLPFFTAADLSARCDADGRTVKGMTFNPSLRKGDR